MKNCLNQEKHFCLMSLLSLERRQCLVYTIFGVGLPDSRSRYNPVQGSPADPTVWRHHLVGPTQAEQIPGDHKWGGQ